MPDDTTRPETVILANGEYPADGSTAAALLHNTTRVVCCDGAADSFVRHGGRPTVIIGDGDSLSRDTLQQFADITVHVAEQDTNDLSKAFRHCMSKGWHTITILGATGKREDHTIGNISLLADYALQADVQMLTQTGVFNAVHGRASFECRRGQQVSIFSMTPYSPIHFNGLRYLPPQEGLRSWWSGTLNEAEGETFTIESESPALVFRAFERK